MYHIYHGNPVTYINGSHAVFRINCSLVTPVSIFFEVEAAVYSLYSAGMFFVGLNLWHVSQYSSIFSHHLTESWLHVLFPDWNACRSSFLSFVFTSVPPYFNVNVHRKLSIPEGERFRFFKRASRVKRIDPRGFWHES